MKNEICPLCLSRALRIIEKIKVSDITYLYKSIHDFETDYLFTNKQIFLLQCQHCKLKFFTDVKPGDEKFYAMLQDNVPDYYEEAKQEFNLVLRYFRKTYSVLEVGCGEGRFAELLDVYSYTGLDLNSNAISKAKGKNLEVYNTTIQDFSYSRKTKFDIVCGFQVLEHLGGQEIRSFFKGAQKLLKENGLLILSVPADDSFVGNHPNLVLNLPPHHLTRWPDETFHQIETLFDLKLTEFINEDLKEKNFNAWIINSILSKLNIRRKVVERNIPIHHKIVYKVVRYTNFRLKQYIINNYQPRGHSIIVVYEKIKE